MKIRFISHLRSRANRRLLLLVTGVSCLAFAFVFGAFSETVNSLHSKPIKVGVDTSEIHRFSSNQVNNKKLRYFTYLPNPVNDSMQVMFVMHGTDRNAMDYLDAWTDFADLNNYLIVAPEFSELIKGETFDYQEGYVWNQHHAWNSKEDWAFSTIERIFGELKINNALVADSFHIFGHSAGAQFVHRMLLFMPEAHIKTAFAANAGWYTFPNQEEKFPYGINLTAISDQSLALTFNKKLFVLLGSDDVKNDHLRDTEKANKQGRTRIQRGTQFFKFSGEKAKSLDAKFNWTKKIIKHTGHNYILMSKEAQKMIMEQE
jgi:pimeloyl-ACP methyl ester carboxylesterase